MGRDGAKREAWRRRIERQRRSGRTVQAFCLDEGIAPAAFYYWKRALRCDLAGAGARSRAIEREAVADAAVRVDDRGDAGSGRFGAGGFLPLTVLADGDNGASAALEIEFSQGVRLHVRADCDRGLLRDVLDWCRFAVGGEPC
jgi:transposase-like protein